MPSARQQDHTIEILHFPAFDLAIFAVNIMRVRVGQQFADCGSTRATMRHVDNGLWIEAMSNSRALQRIVTISSNLHYRQTIRLRTDSGSWVSAREIVGLVSAAGFEP